MSTTDLVTQNAELAELSPDVAAYLAELDKLNSNRGAIITPTIGCMRTPKEIEMSGIPMGNYFKKIKKDDKIEYTDLGKQMNLVILRIANQYTYFDAIDNRLIFKTTEFGPGIANDLMCVDAANNVVFKGTPKEFKEWALKNHPKFDANPQYPTSMFKYATNVYVADPFSTEAGTSNGVYKMSFSTTNNDYLWKYQQSISGFPIRYITSFTPEAQDKGANRWYINKLEAQEELPALQLVEMIKLKQDLDKYIHSFYENLKVAKVDDFEDAEIMEEVVEVKAPILPPVVPPVAPNLVATPELLGKVLAESTAPSLAKTAEEALKAAEDVFG